MPTKLLVKRTTSPRSCFLSYTCSQEQKYSMHLHFCSTDETAGVLGRCFQETRANAGILYNPIISKRESCLKGLKTETEQDGSIWRRLIVRVAP
eukprot:42558-Eustigmatos_ZCMA.PRE.1